MTSKEITKTSIYKRAVESLHGRNPEEVKQETLNEIYNELGVSKIADGNSIEHFKTIKVLSTDSLLTRMQKAIQIIRFK